MRLAACILLLVGCRENLTPVGLEVDRSAARAWHRVLQNGVDREGWVDYERIALNRDTLDEYVAWIGTPEAIRLHGGADGHAFWVNAFNALTIHQVLHRGSPGSVRDVPGWLPWPGSGFFVLTEYRVNANRHMSLWEIAHERVLNAHQDYRDLATLCFGTRSAPPMKAGLYSAEAFPFQLESRFRFWVNHPNRLLHFDGDEVVFNPVLQAFSTELDLWTHGTDLCTITGRHARGERRERLRELAGRGCPHRFEEPDWRLNDSWRVAGWRRYLRRRARRDGDEL